MRNVLLVAGLSLVGLFALPGREARGTTVTLQQGQSSYSGCQDSFLYRDDANTNYNGYDYLRLWYHEETG